MGCLIEYICGHDDGHDAGRGPEGVSRVGPEGDGGRRRGQGTGRGRRPAGSA